MAWRSSICDPKNNNKGLQNWKNEKKRIFIIAKKSKKVISTTKYKVNGHSYDKHGIKEKENDNYQIIKARERKNLS